MLKQIGYFANWPTLNDVGYKRCGGPSFDDTRIPGNMAEPLNHGRVFRCDVCGQEFDVPVCIFEDAYYAAHAHGAQVIEVQTDNGIRIVALKAVREFADGMAMAMQETIKSGVSPSRLFG